MKFISITLQNFLSHVDTTVFLQNRGVVLIKGTVLDDAGSTSNGAGKSSIVEAIVYALYGRTLRGATGTDVIHRRFKNNCLVRLVLEDDKGTRIEIVRTQKHKTKSFIQIGDDTQHGTTAIDTAVSRYIGLSFDAFVSSIIYGRSGTKYFTQLTSTGRSGVLEEVLALQFIERIAENNARYLKDVRQRIQTTTQEIIRQEERCKFLPESIERARRTYDTFEATRRLRLDEANATLLKHTTDLERTKVTWQKSTIALAAATSKLTALYDDAEQANAAVNKARTFHDVATGILHEKTALVTVARNHLDNIATGGATCPQCQQFVSLEHAQRIYDKAQEVYTQAHADMQDADGVCKQTLFLLNAKLEAADAVAKVIFPLELEKTRAEQDIASSSRACELLEHEIATTQSVIAIIEAEENHLEITNLETQLAEAQDTFHALQRQLAGQTHEEEQYVFLNLGFSNKGFKADIMSMAIPYLNARCAYYSDLLTDGLLRVTVSNTTTLKTGETRDKIDVEVSYGDGCDTYTLASDGQRARADVVCAMALGDLTTTRITHTLDLLVLDEVFDGLDATGISRVIKMLHDMTTNRSTILVITHTSSLASQFDNIIEVVYQDGVSHIV